MSAGPGEVLDRLVASGQDAGATVAVVRDGVMEVDHIGGTRDGAVAEGAVELDQTVASVWPEFGCRGKQATTMRHLLSHQAGLSAFPEAAAQVDYDDREALVGLLAEAAPVHPPGAGIAEHALTYGHLLDEVLRRVTGVPLHERFAVIARASGWDLHLRVEGADLARVARLVEPTGDWASGYLADPRWGPALGRPPGLLDPEVLNSERFRRTPFPAVSLHASALSLARFYDDVTRPDGLVAELLGHDLWRAYTRPAATGFDQVVGRDVTWTLGFQLSEEDGRVDLGMGGAGGCAAWAEPAARYGAAFLTRGLGSHGSVDQVWDAVHRSFVPR